jgi:hypothetical protein
MKQAFILIALILCETVLVYSADDSSAHDLSIELAYDLNGLNFRNLFDDLFRDFEKSQIIQLQKRRRFGSKPKAANEKLKRLG